MKTINTYINEKLQLTSKHQYTCQPKDADELQSIIIKRIENEGPDCDLNDIDTSKITEMSKLFHISYCKLFKDFNGDISLWDVSHVEDMYWMFYGCEKFNCDISRWNVSNVTTMSNMFSGCKQFDCDISKWDVSNVTNMYFMFNGCRNFNQNLDSWNVSKVKTMYHAFEHCPTQPDWYDKGKYNK